MERNPIDVAQLTVEGAMAAAGGHWRAVDAACALLSAHAGRVGRQTVTVGVGTAFALALARVWAAGWQPEEVARQVRRSRTGGDPELLVAAMDSADTWRDARSAPMPEAWSLQLRALGVNRSGRLPQDWLGGWIARAGLSLAQALPAVLDTLGVLVVLPVIEPLLPRPSEWGSPPRARAGRQVDDPMLAKIRALLAKAESTSFAPEAEALTGKAQELMARHSIDEALARAGRPEEKTPAARRMAVDEPYVTAKTSLLQVVAGANGVRCVFYKDLAMMALIGFDSDLDTVELLFTSLLLQASRSMLAQGSAQDRHGTSRTRSFRQSFLLAFASRIQERLESAAASARTQAEGEFGTSLVPVLARRDEAVAGVLQEMFPNTRRSAGPAASNGAGWLAGRTAAERASLGVDHGALDATG